MNKIFHKKYADARKEWLGMYDPQNRNWSLDDQPNISKMCISQFLNEEVIKFSWADCDRSIPHVLDGLKESQRKILYAVKKRNLKFNGSSLKVAQLSGYTAEHTNYHHGEQNLQETIINMCQGFVGTNNIPLLYADGNFGSRLANGKDAASARYVFTKMEELTEYIFRSEDEPLLTQINDDGDLVQPEFYIPIIPMILINGCTAGIGSGWSCNIPCYNPKDIINAIRIWIANDGEILIEDVDSESPSIISMLPEIIPWYRGFIGTIESDNLQKNNRFITKGQVKNINNVIEVTELPIGLSTDKFREFCENLEVEKKLKSLKNYSSPKEVKFLLVPQNEFICSIENLKLHSYLYTSNLVLFNSNNKINKYNNIEEIINEFCQTRLEFYVKRKKYQLDKLKKDLKYLKNKQRFIQEVVDESLIIMKIDEDVIIQELINRKYDEDPKDGGYRYLLDLQVRVFTLNKINQLKNDILNLTNKIENLEKTKETDLWLIELEELELQYDKWLINKNNINKKTNTSKK